MDEKMTYQQRIGSEGEDFAAQYLQSRGFEILDQNYHTRYGELDLVASVTPEKLEKINNTGLLWLQDHPEAPDDWRIDVIAIIMDKDNKVTDIQHFIDID